MQLVYITHSNILDAHALAPWASWVVVVGGAYGALRLCWDVLKTLADLTAPSK